MTNAYADLTASDKVIFEALYAAQNLLGDPENDTIPSSEQEISYIQEPEYALGERPPTIFEPTTHSWHIIGEKVVVSQNIRWNAYKQTAMESDFLEGDYLNLTDEEKA